MEFHNTATGKKFFTSDLPNVMNQLKRIANALEDLKPIEIEPAKVSGTFEEISPDEMEDLGEMKTKFDKWFAQLLKNFSLENFGEFGDVGMLKELVRYAWNANR